jgi:hypothetical protein
MFEILSRSAKALLPRHECGAPTLQGRTVVNFGSAARAGAFVCAHSQGEAALSRGDKLQIPPLRYASVGMTKGGVALSVDSG